ncbi:MAG: putative ABC exporter domain-containing protein, partial [Clostridiales bacterium]|nr:putative ABC exporter domain-containing protein [Clostridiales bacterium]
MLLLLKTGLLQIKNYLFHNKVTLFLTIFSTIAVLAYVIIMSVIPMEEMPFGDVSLDFLACAFVFSLLVMLLSFTQADSMQISETEANVFFVSPIPEHKVLIYIFIKSSSMVFLFLLAFLQLNMNLIRPMFNLYGFQNIRLFLWEALTVCTCVIFGIFLTLVKKKNIFIFYALMLISLAISAVMLGTFAVGAWSSGDIFGYFNSFFASSYIIFVPIVGVLAKASLFVMDVNIESLIYVAIAILTNVLFIASPYYIKVSMGEAAVDAALKNKARRARKRAQSSSGFKVEKEVKESQSINMTGSWAIVSKQWLEYKRSSRFLLSGNVLMTLLLIAIYSGIFKFMEVFTGFGSDATSDDINFIKPLLGLLFVGITAVMALFTSNP